MRIKVALIGVVLGVFLGPVGLFCGDNLIRDVSPSSSSLGQYETLETTFKIDCPCDNPFDSGEIYAEARITTPDGGEIAVPAFYTGSSRTWAVRYAPILCGKHLMAVYARTDQGECLSEAVSFEVSPSGRDGFLRRSKNNHYYLVFDSGKPFFGIGHNVAWVTDNDLSVYERYFSDLAANGCNITRIWINSPWTPCVEYGKVRRYNTTDCKKIDRLMDLAEKYGIYVVLVLDSYGSLMREAGPWSEQCWSKYPYNKTNGGPCSDPEDFFVNSDAKKFYKNRLRYIAARWSHSPAVLAFELWNEVDASVAWYDEMFAYMKAINPHGQLVTTSLGYPWSNNFDESSVWKLDRMDVIEKHIYGNVSADSIGYIISTGRETAEKLKKPFFLGEFGIDSSQDDRKLDQSGSGAALHNSLWASALSGSFSTPLNWWWAGYIRGRNMYPHYKAIAAFLEGVDWNSDKVSFPRMTAVMSGEARPAAEKNGTIVVIVPAKNWGDTKYADFTVQNNGDVLGGVVNHYLQGLSKKDMRIEPVFRLDYPENGLFLIDVGTVSQGAELVALLDNKEIFRKKYSAGKGTGPWKRSNYLKQYDVYQCDYDETVELKIPKGSHQLRLSNVGKDWMGLKKISLTNYTKKDEVFARALALSVGDTVLLWVQNKAYDWKNMEAGKLPQEIAGSSLAVMDIPDGKYSLEWWDTFDGKVISQNETAATGKTLRVDIPPFSKDIACKIRVK